VIQPMNVLAELHKLSDRQRLLPTPVREQDFRRAAYGEVRKFSLVVKTTYPFLSNNAPGNFLRW
jgi:hypothetical protein